MAGEQVDVLAACREPIERYRATGTDLAEFVGDGLLAVKYGAGMLCRTDAIAAAVGSHVDFVDHGALFLSRVTGRWRVTNADLEAWGELVRNCGHAFSGWKRLVSPITESMHTKRLYQAFEAYQATGWTDEHRRVASRLNFQINLWRGDGLSIFVEGKRPLGNSAIELDIADAAGWSTDWPEDAVMPPAFSERCWDLFDQLPFAIHDILRGVPSGKAAG